MGWPLQELEQSNQPSPLLSIARLSTGQSESMHDYAYVAQQTGHAWLKQAGLEGCQPPCCKSWPLTNKMAAVNEHVMHESMGTFNITPNTYQIVHNLPK